MRRWLLTLFLLASGVADRAALGQTPPSTSIDQSSSTAQSADSIRITSPLGGTGLVTKVRIVVQLTVSPGVTLSPVGFFVDSVEVGTVNTGPPYSVDWVDDNPFEQREITVQAAESTGRI